MTNAFRKSLKTFPYSVGWGSIIPKAVLTLKRDVCIQSKIKKSQKPYSNF